jgi:hypothetical protein
MRHVITIALLAVLSTSVRALPQAPTAGTTGLIEGIVVRSDNGAPVVGAQVMLTFAPAATPGVGAVLGGVVGGVIGGAGGGAGGVVSEVRTVAPPPPPPPPPPQPAARC